MSKSVDQYKMTASKHCRETLIQLHRLNVSWESTGFAICNLMFSPFLSMTNMYYPFHGTLKGCQSGFFFQISQKAKVLFKKGP